MMMSSALVYDHIIARINKASTTVRCIALWNISDKNYVHTRRKFHLQGEATAAQRFAVLRYHLA
jgi:hypothetical protein